MPYIFRNKENEWTRLYTLLTIMSLAFISKVLIGTVGTAAATVPSLAWFNAQNNLSRKIKELEKDQEFIETLNTTEEKKKLKKDPRFLKEMEKEGLMLQYELAKDRSVRSSGSFDEGSGFCYLFLKQDKLNGIKNSLNTSAKQIKELGLEQSNYLCKSYKEIREMAESKT